ncbi:YqaA family protein [Pseudohaliea rubra]|uniref:Putative membrane protein n=1 Tax=Pseudohaliea rubra DSM 19751 TaxID=1265313 RepID=A0A095WXW7_9GAMM|nr:YqaA family protein [Pseudohaliea rubra]KGE03479.1 putative membrane protein [Pseudohaliea rubra DSM 19751]
MAELTVLFASAFLAATFLPFYSEVVFLGLLASGSDPALLVAVATLGNTLGGLVNWVLGLALLRFRERRWWPVSERQLARATAWYSRYGYWSLLFAWLPLGGDALPLVAGTLQAPLWKVAPLLAVGKGLRYAALSLLVGTPQPG